MQGLNNMLVVKNMPDRFRQAAVAAYDKAAVRLTAITADDSDPAHRINRPYCDPPRRRLTAKPRPIELAEPKCR
jgi:hypothetical protein